MNDFQSFAMAHGLQIDKLCPVNRVQRCATLEKPRSRNGAWFWDGVRGWVSDWAQGGELHWFDGGEIKVFTEAERKAWAQRKRAAEARQQHGWENAAIAAKELVASCQPKDHNYLHSKGLGQLLGLVDPDGVLVVPMRHVITNELQGAQRIVWLPEERCYEKKMLPGMRAKAAVFRLGTNRAQETILCEGYATGLSIELAARQLRLSASVLVCFSDGNMAHVAPMVKGRAYCFADNDKSGAGLRAAEKTGLPFCMSDTEGFDANDEHHKRGLMAVCAKLMAVRRMT